MMDKFQQRFIDEAKEYFESMELVLLNLEEDFSSAELIGEIFRIMHSLKGSGAMFGFSALSDATHDLESLYDLIRSGSLKLNSSIIGFTLQSIDLLKRLLKIEIDNDLKAEISLLKADVAKIISGSKPDVADVHQLSGSDSFIKPPQKETKTFFISFQPAENILKNGTNPLYLMDELHTIGECTVKAYMGKVPSFDDIDTDKCYTSWRAILLTEADITEVEDVFLFVKEDGKLNVIPILNEHIHEDEAQRHKLFDLPLEEVVNLIAKPTKQDEKPIVERNEKKSTKDNLALSSIRVNSLKIDEYMNLVSEMITAQSRLMLLAEKKNDQELLSLSESFQKLIRQLRDNASDMSLVPLFNMMARFKRLVRDLSGEMNKEIELVTEGLDTEVDKNMIEKLTDPILHIIRNCIDHGIEEPAERLRIGKPAQGTIRVKAGYVGTFVQVEIQDDGAGLNYERIREKAISKGLIDEDSNLDHSELVQYIFEPGFSTLSSVSDVSGRGVGMDVVRKTIKNLRGEVEVDSEDGKGTHFVIRIPLTLSIIDGLLTRVEGDFFVIPTGNIEKIYALKEGKQVSNLRKVVVLDGREIPYLNLREEFNPNAGSLDQQYLIAIKVSDNQLFGLVVDDVVREYQAVVKPLGRMLKRHDIFFGASILGDGKVALVVDTKKIIQKFSA